MATNIHLILVVFMLSVFGFQVECYSRMSQDTDALTIQSDELEKEEKQVDEELYHGNEKRDLRYDEDQNEFIDDSEQDEIDYELKRDKQDVEHKKQTMEEIDAIEEEINEQP
jgi:hypothetical protein